MRFSTRSSIRFALVAIPLLACEPMGPIPGGTLRGELRETPPDSWHEVANVEQVQLETRPTDPYSVNTWVGVHEGHLYIPTSLIRGADEPTARTWVRNVLEDPAVRVRVGRNVYPLRAVRVEDEAELVAVRAMLLSKYDVEPDQHVAGGWIFRLDPRSTLRD